MGRSKKPRQQTIEATLGRSRVHVSVKKKPTGKGKQVAHGSSSEASPSPVPASPVKESPAKQANSIFSQRPAPKSCRGMRPPIVTLSSSEDEEVANVGAIRISSSSEDEEDDTPKPVRTTRARASAASSTRSQKSLDRNEGDDEGEEENDSDDDDPIVTPASIRRAGRKRPVALNDSDDEPLVSSPVKKRRLIRRGESSPVGHDEPEQQSENQEPPSATQRRGATKRRTEKEKALERLRRKRAGEAIIEEESSSSEEEERKALYDSDSDQVALQEFEDDEEGIPDGEPSRKAKKSSKNTKKQKKDDLSDDSDNPDSNLDDFVVEDDDEPLGVPGHLLDIPLQFTSHSHKPLKEHFRDAVEWTVQCKINPGFTEKKHELYRIAWQKLDDEIGGLAQSKFLSSAWKKDFIMALRARPEIESVEVYDDLATESCEACGRSGHPARFRVKFLGSPYFKKFHSDRFLEPVEVDTSSSSGDGEDAEEDEDEDGNLILPEFKTWYAGAVCHANAETAHMLIHWKMSLLTYVTDELERSGYMAPSLLLERQKMTPKKRHKQVDKIMAKWKDDGTVQQLWQVFQRNIERARNQNTRGWYGK